MLEQGENNMSALAIRYAKDVMSGKRLFSKCPARFQVDIKDYLALQVEIGKLTQEEYENLISQ